MLGLTYSGKLCVHQPGMDKVASAAALQVKSDLRDSAMPTLRERGKEKEEEDREDFIQNSLVPHTTLIRK